ncbi:Vps52/Sac2 [Penicillium bovifimosum]|uniref:Vps52/Sac2 n=1 Tax=Penicillium bovifimosum TaxID=126998 RepID=A0A9W9L8W8_9EURO|nr:Vps52/Sac2 [Penicillium bovifimosum]KAJ5143268.1 Vps52/Sac2 [Penicillium bovifimosum]
MIVEGPIDENWVRALNEIDSRSTNIEAKAVASANGYKAIEDVRPLLVDVKDKVSNRKNQRLPFEDLDFDAEDDTALQQAASQILW